MALKFEVTGDNSNLLASLEGARNGVRQTARDIEESGLGIEDMFKRVGAAAGIAFSLDQAKNFVRSVMDMRGQFQQLEIAFKTMLQSEEKATSLMNQLVETAAKTPFDLQGVAQGAKQLLAYGIAAEDVNETITRLGDIAAGLSIPLGDLVYLYGTTMTQGRMFTNDLRQFMGRGIPMAEELAKQFGVTKNEVGGLVSAGKIGADAVQKAIWSMTDEGSKFGGLMAEQSKSITGQISNIEDAFDTMLNDIGKSNEGLINDGLAGVSYLIENYKEVGRVLLTLVAAYGEYKAALMITSAVKNAQQKYTANTELKELQKEIDIYNQILNKQEQSANADLAGAVAKGKLTEEQARLVAAKREELALLAAEAEMKKASAAQNVSKLTEELDLAKSKLAIAVEEHQAKQADLSLAQQRLAEADKNVKKAQEYLDLQKEINDYEGSDITDDGGGYDELQAAISEQLAASKEVETAAESENSAAKAVNTAETNVNTLSEQLNTAQTELNTLSRGSSTVATETNTIAEEVNTASGWKNIAMQKVMAVQYKASAIAQSVFTAAANECKRAWNALKVAMATNPIGLIASAITLALPFILQWTSATDEATESQKKFGEAIEKETSKARTLIAVIENTSKESKVHKDATDELVRIAEDYGITIDKERDKTDQLIIKKDELIAKIKEEAREREYANQIAENDETYQNEISTLRKKIEDTFGDPFDKYQRNVLANLVSEEDIQKIATLKDRLNEVNEAQKNGTATIAQQNQARSEFYKGVDEIIDKLAQQASAFGKNEEEAKKLSQAVKDHSMGLTDLINQMAGETAAYENSKTAISDAYTTQVNWNDAQEAASAQAAMTKMSIEQLYEATNNLINAWAKQYHLDLVVTVDDTGVPDEWKNATVDQLKKEVARRNAFAEQMNAKYGESWVNKTYYDKQTKKKFTGKQWLEEDANLVAKLHRKNVDKPKASSTPPTTNKEKKSKSKSKGSSWDASEHKYNAQKAMEEFAEDLQDFSDDLFQKITDTQIENIDEKTEQAIKKLEQDEKKELDALDDEQEELIKKQKELNKKVWQEGAQGRKEKDAPETTDEQAWAEILKQRPELEERFESMRTEIKRKYANERYEIEKEEMLSYSQYVQEYGSQIQKVLALEKERQIKLKDASNDWDRKSINQEYDKKVQSVRADELMKSIDWVQLFKGVGTMTKQMSETLRKQLNDLVFSDKFKTLDTQQQEKIVSALNDLKEKLGSDPNVSWEQVGTLMKDLVNAQGAYERASEQEQLQADKVRDIQNKINDENTSEDDRELLKLELKSAEDTLNNYSQETVTAKENMNALGQQINYVTNQLKDYSYELSATIMDSQLAGLGGVNEASGDMESLRNIFGEAQKVAMEQAASGQGSGLMNTIGQGAGIMDGIGQALSSGIGSMIMDMIGIVAKIPQMIMSFAKNIGSAVSGILDGFTEFLKFEWLEEVILSITNSVTSLIQAIFKLPENLGHVLMNIVKEGIGAMVGSIIETVMSAVGLGDYGPDSWFGNGSKIAKEIARLEERNAQLIESIDALRNSFDRTTGVQLIENFEQAIRMQKELERNNQLIIARQMAYSGSHHSWQNNWGGFDDATAATLRRQLNITDKNWRGTVDQLKALTADQWQIVKGNADAWQKINDTGKGGYGGRVAEKIDQAIEQAGKLQEIYDSLNQALTQITFDDLFNSFVDTLSDMDSSAEDFAHNFEEYMKKAVMSSLSEEYRERLKAWYEDFATAMKPGGVENIEFDGKTFHTEKELLLYFEDKYLNKNHGEGGEVWATDYGGSRTYFRRSEGGDDAVLAWLLKQARVTFQENDTGATRLTAEERQRLLDQYNGIMSDAIEERNIIRDFFGWTGEDYKQEASSKGFQSMGQETAEELNGRFTALQISGENIEGYAQMITENLAQMIALSQGNSTVFSEIRDLIVTSNTYLYDIARYSKRIHEDFGMKIDTLNAKMEDAYNAIRRA